MDKNSDVFIRQATIKDMEALVRLCQEHAAFEGQPYDVKNKEKLLASLLLRQDNDLHSLLVFKNNQLVGYATFVKQISTWDADYYLYLDCLYLKKELRGYGIGRQLMKKISAFAKLKNCKKIEWQTPSINLPAIGFYEHLGAMSKSKKRFFLQVQ